MKMMAGMTVSRSAGPVLTRRVAHGEKDGAPEGAFSARPSQTLNGKVGSRPAGPLLTRGIVQRREGWHGRSSDGSYWPPFSELSPSSLFSSSSSSLCSSGSR